MTDLRLHRFIARTRTEGPGLRACVQVQGCPIRCIGCAVPQTWSKRGGITIDTAELADEILLCEEIEGVTFLGGEPFAQAGAVAEVAAIVRRAGLSVMTFTGYTLEELGNLGSPAVEALLGETDLLVDGPFLIEESDLSRPWVGSRNQKFHFLTDRYSPLTDVGNTSNKIELRIFSDGRVLANGLAPVDQLKRLISTLGDPTG